jgi:hypothetical protein
MEAHVDAVLPPDGKGPPKGRHAEHASEVARIIAFWMDEFIHIPGTKIRLGLDPILGLIPGLGGLLSSSVSLVVVVDAVKRGVAPSVLGRMGLNIVINEILDAIPIVGDAASIFFKSNSRNLALLNRWKAGETAAVKRGSRAILTLIAVLIFGVLGLWLGLCFSLGYYVIGQLRELLS